MALIQGFTLSLSLLCGIGPQNLFVMRSALHRQGIVMVIGVCLLGEGLCLIGAYWIGSSVGAINPVVVSVTGLCGAVLLVWYALQTLRHSREGTETDTIEADAQSTGQVLIAILALTFLNPLVYIDVIGVLGSAANYYPPATRGLFLLGAFGAACLWFPLLACASRLVGKELPHVMRGRTFSIIFSIYLLWCAAQLGAMALR